MAAVSKRTDKFTLILEEEETGFSVHCPALPGCVSQGDDRALALMNIRQAIELILEVRPEGDRVQESATTIGNEIREILESREEDGLPFAGIFIEQVRVVVKAVT